jgi:hypothetical protein
VSGNRVGNETRFRLSRASPTTSGTIRLVFAIGSTPSFDDGVLGSFHGSRRVTQNHRRTKDQRSLVVPHQLSHSTVTTPTLGRTVFETMTSSNSSRSFTAADDALYQLKETVNDWLGVFIDLL